MGTKYIFSNNQISERGRNKYFIYSAIMIGTLLLISSGIIMYDATIQHTDPSVTINSNLHYAITPPFSYIYNMTMRMGDSIQSQYQLTNITNIEYFDTYTIITRDEYQNDTLIPNFEVFNASEWYQYYDDKELIITQNLESMLNGTNIIPNDVYIKDIFNPNNAPDGCDVFFRIMSDMFFDMNPREEFIQYTQSAYVPMITDTETINEDLNGCNGTYEYVWFAEFSNETEGKFANASIIFDADISMGDRHITEENKIEYYWNVSMYQDGIYEGSEGANASIYMKLLSDVQNFDCGYIEPTTPSTSTPTTNDFIPTTDALTTLLWIGLGIGGSAAVISGVAYVFKGKGANITYRNDKFNL